MAKVYDFSNKRQFEMFINLVSETILQNNLSLFLGAGSSMQYNAMNWNELINRVYSGCKQWRNTERAQYAELSGIDVKSEIAKEISLVKVDAKKECTYLNYLLNFDYKSLWTTNYDCVIEEVLKEKGKNIIPVYQYSDFPQLSFPGGYFLFKINGSYISSNTIVITHEDFIEYRKTHEAYLILLKRELLCNSFLFLGCSFDDDILRMCIKDILNCIENSKENYSTNHYAIIVENNKKKMDFISKDLSKHYNINCLKINNTHKAYLAAYIISLKVKYSSIFISGAKMFKRYTPEENIGRKLCQDLINAFMKLTDFPFKFISGMGMSIGHFISGTVKQNCKDKNLNRYLQMEPFPFTSKEANEKHREDMISKAGIFIFIYGDDEDITKNGMWKEYMIAKQDRKNIIVPLPCGTQSMSNAILQEEKKDKSSFSATNLKFLESFDYTLENEKFFEQLANKIVLITRKNMDYALAEMSDIK